MYFFSFCNRTILFFILGDVLLDESTTLLDSASFYQVTPRRQFADVIDFKGIGFISRISEYLSDFQISWNIFQYIFKKIRLLCGFQSVDNRMYFILFFSFNKPDSII